MSSASGTLHIRLILEISVQSPEMIGLMWTVRMHHTYRRTKVWELVKVPTTMTKYYMDTLLFNSVILIQ